MIDFRPKCYNYLCVLTGFAVNSNQNPIAWCEYMAATAQATGDCLPVCVPHSPLIVQRVVQPAASLVCTGN